MDINNDADLMNSFPEDIFNVSPEPVSQPAPQAPYQQPVQQPVQPQYTQQPPRNAGMQPMGGRPMGNPVPAQPQYTQPVQPDMQPYDFNAPQDTLSLDEAQNEADIMKPIAMGQRGSNVPVEKYKGSKQKKSRITIISEEPYPLYIHYDKEVGGSFICFQGDCCKKDFAREKYCFPIIEYPTMPNGSPVQGQPCTLKLLVVGKDAYEQIVDIWTSKGNKLTGYDLLVSCTDDTYQKLLFTAQANTVMNNYPDVNMLKQQWLEKKDRAYLAVGKFMDAKTYNALKSIKDPGSSVPSMNTVYNSQA